MTPPPSPAPPAIACPSDDWVSGATTAKCYRKVAGAFTHKECAVQCGEGSLVCIDSQAENDLLFNDLFTIDGISWIGLYQEYASADSTDSWTWSNGCASTSRGAAAPPAAALFRSGIEWRRWRKRFLRASPTHSSVTAMR